LNYKAKSKLNEQDRDSIIVVVHWIGAAIDTCFFPSSRRCALELLLVIGKQLPIDLRLQYILPYVLNAFEDKLNTQSKVLAKAIEVAVRLLEDILEEDCKLALKTSDYQVFKDYIMPQFHKLNRHKADTLIQTTFIRYFPLLTRIGLKLQEISSYQRMIARESGSDDKPLQRQFLALNQEVENLNGTFSNVITNTVQEYSEHASM
jgi:hypothetical protein